MNPVDLARDACPTCGGKLGASVQSGRCMPCLLRLGFTFDDGDVDGACEDIDPEVSGATGVHFPAAPGVFADYELIEAIGRGAMGVVFKARQKSLDRLVALKVLDLAEKLPPDAAKRFRVEASAAAALRHPGIVTIHEVGVHQGRHYLAMDLIEGETLATLVAKQPLTSNRAARLLAAVADAIQCAHERGILHRDIKPSNILVDAVDKPHVADFGLAKRMQADADLTIPGFIMGSPNYMSPEQARGAALGPASDVHALGAVLYHCVSGRPPFIGQTIPDTLHHVIHGEPVALRLLVAGVPRDLDTIALKCLQKDPLKRYTDARALADDLRRYLRREPITARPVSRSERLWRWCRRRPAIAGLTAATVSLVLAVAIGSPVAILRIQAERERAEGAAVRMHAERERAEDNLYAADMNLAQEALAHSSRGQVRALLERHRPAASEVDRRGFEWRYLWTQTEPDDREIFRTPTRGFRQIVRIPGTTLVAIGDNVWDPRSPSRGVFPLPVESVVMAFDPLERSLLVSRAVDRPGFDSWSLTTGQSRELLKDEIVHAVALSPDGRWMATGSDMHLTLWAREGDSWRSVHRRELVFMRWHNSQTLVFAPDGSFLVTGNGAPWGNRCELQLLSVPSLDPLPGLKGSPRNVLSLAISSDGRHLFIGCYNGRVRDWDLITKTERAVTMRHPGGGFLTDLEFSPVDSDVLASTGADGTVRLWNVKTGEELVALQGANHAIFAITFDESGQKIFSSERSGRFAVWDVTLRRNADALSRSGRPTLPLGFSADSATLATIDDNGELRYWDMAQRREIAEKHLTLDIRGLYMSDFEVIAPVMSQDMKMLAIGTTAGQVQLWRLPSRVPQTWTAHANYIRNLAISPDGKTLVSIDAVGVLKLWNIISQVMLAEITIPGPLAGKNDNFPLVFSPDGKTVTVANNVNIMIYDAANGRLLHTLDPQGQVYSLRASPDGQLLVSGQRNRTLGFWEPRSGALLEMVSTSLKGGAWDFSFSPDGRTLVSVGDQVKVWSVATRMEVGGFRVNDTLFSTLFSPDGNSLVAADYGGSVWLWSALPFEAIDGGASH